MTDATETPRQMGRAYLIGYAADARGRGNGSAGRNEQQEG